MSGTPALLLHSGAGIHIYIYIPDPLVRFEDNIAIWGWVPFSNWLVAVSLVSLALVPVPYSSGSYRGS